MKKAFVTGGSGFIGKHLCKRLKDSGYYIVAASRHYPAYGGGFADEYHVQDLTYPFALPAMHEFDEVYALAGEVGGLGYIQNQANDFEIMDRSTRINLNTIYACRKAEVPRLFFASSACVYPDLYYKPENVDYDLFNYDFVKPNDGGTPEWAAYPAQPINAFGWEKLYAERMYEAYGRQSGTAVRIGRLGNTYGPYCAWEGDRAKVVASICRKVAEAEDGGKVDIWGDGEARRSFTYVDDAVEGIIRLMASDYPGPVNIASTETVSINRLHELTCSVAGKILGRNHINGPVGVRGRTSDNTLVQQVLGWEPRISLVDGLQKLYLWVKEQVDLRGSNVVSPPS